MLDMRRRWWTEAGEKHPFGAPTVPGVVMENHIKAVEKGESPRICSVGQPPERLPLCMVAVQQGLFPRLMGTEAELYPMEVLEKVEEDKAPAMWLYHGKQVRCDARLDTEKCLELTRYARILQYWSRTQLRLATRSRSYIHRHLYWSRYPKASTVSTPPAMPKTESTKA